MPIEHRYSPVGTVVTLFSTDINTLTNNSRVLSAAIDPTADRYLFGDVELALPNAMSGSPTADTTVELYLLPTVDGTTYADGSTTLTPKSSLLVAVFAMDNQTTQRKIIRGIALPVQSYKALIINKTGVSFNASGNTVKLLPYSTRGV